MEPENQRKENTRNIAHLEQDFSVEANFFDFCGGKGSFLSQDLPGNDTNFTCSSDFDRHIGLQVVPGFDDEVFAGSFSQTAYEHNGIHQHRSIGSLSQENLGKLYKSMTCLPEERKMNTEKGLCDFADLRRQENTTTLERRQSDTDSLDVYLKPCVFTPTKVEDLYSTLQGADNLIFQFPPEQEIQLSSTLRANQICECKGSEILPFKHSQLYSVNSYDDLNIETNNEDNLDLYHSNLVFEQKSHSCSTTNMTLSHRLENGHSKPEAQAETEGATNVKFSVSKSTEIQESRDYFERSNSLSFPPFLVALSNQRILTPKPNQVPRLSKEKKYYSNLEENEYLNMENKDDSSLDKRKKSNFPFEDSRTTWSSLEDEKRSIINKDAREEARTINDHGLGCLSSRSKKSNKEWSSKTLTSKYKATVTVDEVQMSHVQDIIVTKTHADHDSRINHNDTEKQRRDIMKNRFENLRKVIPKIKKTEKTPKVQILKQASTCIRFLESEEQTLEEMKTIEKEKNLKLLKRLQNTVTILRESPRI